MFNINKSCNANKSKREIHCFEKNDNEKAYTRFRQRPIPAPIRVWYGQKEKTTKTTIRAHSKLTDKCVMQNNKRRCSSRAWLLIVTAAASISPEEVASHSVGRLRLRSLSNEINSDGQRSFISFFLLYFYYSLVYACKYLFCVRPFKKIKNRA